MSKHHSGLDFKVNDHVVYPAHGVGKVNGVETQEVAGMSLEVYVITFDHEKMTLRVPTKKAKTAGLRPLAAGDVVSKALTTLKGRARVKRTGKMAPRPGVRSQDQLRRPDLDRVSWCATCTAPRTSRSSPTPNVSSMNRRSTAWRAKSPPSNASTVKPRWPF